MVTKKPPQMKNWRNIIRLRRGMRFDCVLMTLVSGCFGLF
jgi:hypothetical protein